MTSVLALVTGICITLVVYHHAIWPALLAFMARRGRVDAMDVPTRRYRELPSDSQLPTIAIVIPAFNERETIADKIRNLALLDYPPARLQIIIACDGCTDDTVARARAAAAEPPANHLRVAIREFSRNRGKVAVLNEIVPTVTAELVGLSDVSALISVDALLIAARHFRDPQIGVVCATYRLLQPGSAGEAAYWRYQLRLKINEAIVGAPLGAHGAFYLLRGSLFHPLPADTINDDFVLPMGIVALGFRAAYEPRMVAVELERSTPRQDLSRRQRIAAGNLQQAMRLRGLLHPRYGRLALAFASGKALRAIMPFILAESLAGSLLLADGAPLWTAIAAGQCVLYATVALRLLSPGLPWPRLVDSTSYLVRGHFAGLIGATRYLVGLERQGLSHGRHVASRSLAAMVGGVVLPRQRLHIHPLVAIAKRVIDCAVAILILLVTLPLWPLIALAIRLDSPGPIFFRQLRVGESLPDQTLLFQIIKFRTMRVEEIPRAKWATTDDPRITPVGRFLRRTRLDELPQAINVLRGEMSLVGPRPEQPALVHWLVTMLPYYSERTYGVKPGITGFAQISQTYDQTIEDVRSKLSFDHAYGLSLSRPTTWLKLEIQIIYRTMIVMVQGAGH